MFNGKFWFNTIALVGLLIWTSQPAWAVTQADVVRLKHKVAAGEMLSPSERQLVADAKREFGSMISAPLSNDRPRQPGGTLDEYEYSLIPYEWVDITDVGQASGITSDDQLVGPFDLGFSVNFYDISYNSVYMCSNGWANFVGNSAAYWNGPIPDTFDPHAVIYAFWDDLYPPMGGEYYYYQDTANDRFILSWIDVPHISDNTELYTFQIIINSSGTIQINYNSISEGGIGNSSCTSGVENETSTEGLQIWDNGAGEPPVSESSVLIVLPDGIPNPVTGLVGTVNDHDVTLSWTDPTHDTNGNPVTLTNIEVFMGPPGDGDLQATVLPGVETVTLLDVADGMRQFYVRATADPYFGSAAAVQVLVGSPSYANDFNTNDGQWESADGWTWGEITNVIGPNEHSEPFCWGSNMDAPYPDLADYNLYLDLGLAVGSEDAYMEFWIYYDLEFFWDGCNIKVSLDGGGTWEIVEPETPYPCSQLNQSQNVMTGEPCWSGQSQAWEHVVIPLGPYNGEAPIFRIQAASDEVVSGYAGAYIDDMLIWGLTEPVFTTVSGNVFLDGGTGNVQSVVVRANGYGAPFTSPAGNGDYTLSNVIVGERRITATLAAYDTEQITVDVVDGGVTDANITLVRSAPPAPTNVTGSVNSANGMVTIEWTNSTDILVDTYRIYRRLAGDENFVLVGTDPTSPFNETLTVDGIYQYRVTAVDINVTTPVESPPSLMVTVLYGELPVPQLGANGDFDDRIRLSWLSPGTLDGTELGYDDGTAEFYFTINWPSGPADYLAVRFSTPDDAIFPLLVYSATLFVQNEEAIPWIGICPPQDGADGPDLDNPYIDWEGLTADSTPGWVMAETEGSVILEEPADFYVVMQIPPGVTENQTTCGTDDSQPDSRTYYAWEPPFFNLVTWSDCIMRVWLGGPLPSRRPQRTWIWAAPKTQTTPTTLRPTTTTCRNRRRHRLELPCVIWLPRHRRILQVCPLAIRKCA
ncbi:MAG: hypothetical protein IPG71_13395 [bacterium]|nr:hypothetical protein [bacterium]